jgi:tetratricopeptide (TPR) repeat protein
MTKPSPISTAPKEHKAYGYRGRGEVYFSKKDYEKALLDFDKSIQLDPTQAYTFVCRGAVYSRKGSYKHALSEYAHALKINPKSPDAHYALAWFRSTCPEQGFRDGKQALDYARKALELGDERDYEPLAAAYAELGQFKEAVRWQKKALKALESTARKAVVEKVRQRLKLYEQGKPHRQPPPLKKGSVGDEQADTVKHKSWVGELVVNTKPPKDIRFRDRLDGEQTALRFSGRLSIKVRDETRCNRP